MYTVYSGKRVCVLLPYDDLYISLFVDHLNRRTPAVSDDADVNPPLANSQALNIETGQPGGQRRLLKCHPSFPGIDVEPQRRLQQ